MFIQLLLVIAGASVGATSRWLLGLWLNPLFSQLAFGTLFANWLGCFLIGITLAFSLQEPQKLLFIVGFLGSFTTFSSFSSELVSKILQEKWLNFVTIFSLHTVGGLLMTLFGVFLVKWWVK